MTVRQAANVVALMEYFAQRRRPATLAQIGKALDWPRTSAFNLVGTLAAKGYLYEPRERGAFYPTPRWLANAVRIAAGEPLPEAAALLAAEVAERTGETVVIGGQAGTALLFLHVVETPAPIRYVAAVGDRVPIHASSPGRAILAQMPAAERLALYRRVAFRRYAETTPMDGAAVEAKLAEEMAAGHHRSLGEFAADLSGVAVPLPLGGRRLSICVLGPHFRFADRAADIAEALKDAATRLMSGEDSSSA